MGFSPDLVPYYSVTMENKKYSFAKTLYSSTHHEETGETG
jgi:hypothetical protein